MESVQEQTLEVLPVQEQTLEVLREIITEAKTVSTAVQRIIKRVEDGKLNTAKGISLLEVKHQLMSGYLLNLSHLMYTELCGESIEGSPDIWRLVEIRTFLEKMRPIEHKLKYQIDKLIQTAVAGSLAKDDPLSFKPNPDKLISKIDDNSDASSDDETEDKNKPKIYVPPKLAAMHYDGDLSSKDKRQIKFDRAKKRALSSSIMQDLKDEYSEAPDEIQESVYSSKRLKKELRERADYEEDHFVRLALPKKTRSDMRQQQRMQSNLDKLTNFGDISVLDKVNYDPTEKKRSKKGMKRKAKKGGKKSRKRGRFGH